MGRGPIRYPPRHLAAARRSLTDAREHAAAEWALAAVAILLTAAVVIGSMFQRPGSRAPGSAVGPPAAVSTTGPAPSSTAGGGPAPAGNLVADPGFEASVAGWLAIGGAKVGRAPVARAGRWAGGFTPTGLGDQGMALTQVLRCTPGSTYAAAVWVRASRPRSPTWPTGRALPWPSRSSSPRARPGRPSWSTTWSWWPTGPSGHRRK